MQAALPNPANGPSTSPAGCPSCGGALVRARTIRENDGFVDLQIFSCRTCSLWLTEAEGIKH
jgi:hypothetical protein